MKGIMALLRDSALVKGPAHRTEGTIPPRRIMDYFLDTAQPQLIGVEGELAGVGPSP